MYQLFLLKGQGGDEPSNVAQTESASLVVAWSWVDSPLATCSNHVVMHTCNCSMLNMSLDMSSLHSKILEERVFRYRCGLWWSRTRRDVSKFCKKRKKNYGYMYVIRCNMYFVINSFTWNYLGNQRSKLEVLTSSGLSEVWTAFLCEYTSSILQELVSFSGNTCCIGRRVAQAGSYVHMYVFLWGGFPGFGLKSNLTLYDLLPPHHDCALTSHFHSRDLYHCIPC